MTLTEYVDEKINDLDVHDEFWFPSGWIMEKGGPLHVEDADNEAVALCGIEKPEQPFAFGPARAMLRRNDGCKDCEEAVKDEPEN